MKEETLKIGNIVYPLPKNFEDFDPKIMQQWTRMEIPKESAGICGIIYGKRGAGKTVALTDFVYQNKKCWDEVYLFSQTAFLQKGVYDYVPEEHQFDSFDVDSLNKIISHQLEDVDMKLKNNEQTAIKHLLFIFDDVISDERIRHTPAFNQLFTMGRHLRCSALVLTQSVGGRDGISKVVRDNVDFVVAFFPYNELDRDAIVERYLSLHHKKIGDMVIKDITIQEFTSIAIVIRKPASRRYEDYVFRWKANPKVPKFMIGSKNMKALKDMCINPMYKKTAKFVIPHDPQENIGTNYVEL